MPGITAWEDDPHSSSAAAPDRASRVFVEDLLRRGRVDTSAVALGSRAGSRAGRTTHALVREGRDVRLIRCLFHERPEYAETPPAVSARS